MTELFDYINTHKLGIELIQPQMVQVNNYITENLNRIEQLKQEFSNLTPDALEKIESAQAALLNIQKSVTKVREIAEENGKTFEIAGSLD